VGVVTRVVLAVALLLATPCWAQSKADVDMDLFAAGKELERIGPAVAQAVIAVDLCGGGDAEPWKHVVAAIDERHKRCIAEDAKWKDLTEKPDALAGTYAFEAFLSTHGAEARSQGAADYCGRVPWKAVLDPVATAGPTKEAFLRDHLKVSAESLDEFVAMMGWIRKLGKDTRWLATPCKSFWPEGPR
jgi:hypothetical protein